MQKLDRLITVLTLGLMFIADIAHAQGPVLPSQVMTPNTTGITRIACVGDSITAGADASSDSATYPSLLQAWLGPKFVVGNFGESGSTLLKSGNSPFWQRGGYANSLKFAPDIVVLMLGTNDTKPYNWVYKAQFQGDYEALVDYYKDSPTHPQIYVCLPPFVTKSVFDIVEPPIDEQIPIIEQVAAEKGVQLIDVHDGLGNDMSDFADGVHPNDIGYQKLAKTIFDAIADAPIVSPPGDAFYTPDMVTIALPPGATDARYTTDGTLPTSKSASYTKPISVRHSAVLTVQAYNGDTPVGIPMSDTFTKLAPLPALKQSGTEPGVKYSYFEGAFTHVADLRGLTPVSQGTEANIDITPHKVETNFAFDFSGFIDVPSDGLYTFTTTSDDGSALSIDGSLIVDNDNPHGPRAVGGKVALKKGEHAIDVSYFQGAGGYSLNVTWQGPKFAEQAIPSSQLSN